jgi:RNA polymerase sigma factor (sigma-70 family)
MPKESARRALGVILRAGLTSPLTDAQLLNQFVLDGAAEAFAEIVRRHGTMVFGVCRRVLGHEQDAEDAFQATFLVLARKAGAVRPMESLGRWLYGVAFRIARNAKSRRHRESERLANVADQIQTDKAKPPAQADWLPLLDEELKRLPERDRLPIVLCDLMGRSRKEAAEELGLSEGTLSSRLARGRDRLRDRLERRGVVPSITAVGVALETSAAPAALVHPVSNPATGMTTSAAAILAQGVIRAMLIHTTVKTIAIVTGIVLFGAVGLRGPVV